MHLQANLFNFFGLVRDWRVATHTWPYEPFPITSDLCKWYVSGSGGGGLEDMSVKQRQKMVRKRFGQTGKIQDAVFLVDQLLYIEENFLPTSSAKK